MSFLDTLLSNVKNIAAEQYYNHEYRKNTGQSTTHNAVKALSNMAGMSPALGVGTNYPAITSPASDNPNRGATRSWDAPVVNNNSSIVNTGSKQTGSSSAGSNINTSSYNSEIGDMAQNAQNARQSALDATLQRLSLMRDIASQSIGRAKGVRDEVVGNIGTTYQNLIKSAENKKNTALENLGQEDLSVQNQYGRAEGTARRAVDSALTKNRMLARAMNRLNSSFYDDRQAETNETGARTVADIDTEEAGKLAGIGTRKTETKNWFEEQSVNLGAEEAQMKSQAERDYQTQVDEAITNERAYGIDSLEAAQNAENEYQSKLDQISQYVQNKGLRLAEIAATAGDRTGVINSFSAISPSLQALLSNAKALNSAQTLSSQLPTFSGTTTSQTPDYTAFMKDTQPNDQLERLRRIFGYS